jgi:TolB-like protein
MKNILVSVIIILSSCATLPDSYSFNKALEIGINKIENDLPDASNIAILDFKSDNENLSFFIVEEMYDKLINLKKFSIMERSRIDTISLEVGYQFSGEVNDNEIINIGHQLGAEYIVTGQIIFTGEVYRLRIFAIDIEKGKRFASSSINILSNDREINYFLQSNIKETTIVKKGYKDSYGNTVIGDVCPDGYGLIPPLGAPPVIQLFKNENEYISYLKNIENDIKKVGYWVIKDSKYAPTNRTELIEFTQDYWDIDVNTNICAYIFIYHHSENRVSLQYSNESQSFIKTYYLGEQDNL